MADLKPNATPSEVRAYEAQHGPLPRFQRTAGYPPPGARQETHQPGSEYLIPSRYRRHHALQSR